MNVPYGTAQTASRTGDGWAKNQSWSVARWPPTVTPKRATSHARRSQRCTVSGETPTCSTTRIES